MRTLSLEHIRRGILTRPIPALSSGRSTNSGHTAHVPRAARLPVSGAHAHGRTSRPWHNPDCAGVAHTGGQAARGTSCTSCRVTPPRSRPAEVADTSAKPAPRSPSASASARVRLAVDQPHLLAVPASGPRLAQQIAVVGVAGQAVEHHHLRLQRARPAQDAHLGPALHQPPAQRVGGLVADDQDRAARRPRCCASGGAGCGPPRTCRWPNIAIETQRPGVGNRTATWLRCSALQSKGTEHPDATHTAIHQRRGFGDS